MPVKAATPPTAVEQLAELRDKHAALNREHTALHDRYMRLLTERERWSERVRAAARRTTADNVIAFAHLHLSQAIGELGGYGLDGLLRLIRELSDRPTARVLASLRSAALNVEHGQRLIRDRDGDLGDVYTAVRAEEMRLRAHITATGRRLHAAHGNDSSDPQQSPCECAGCELIIGMDLVDDGAEPAPDGEPVTLRTA